MINKLYSLFIMLSIITVAHGAAHPDSLTRTLNSSHNDRKMEHRRQCEIAHAAVATTIASLGLTKTPEYITFHEIKSRSCPAAMPFIIERTDDTKAVMLVGFAEGQDRKEAKQHALEARHFLEQQLYAYPHISRISPGTKKLNFAWGHWAYEVINQGTCIGHVKEGSETTNVHENITKVVYGPGTPRHGLSRVTLHIQPYLAAVQRRLEARQTMHSTTAESCFTPLWISMPGPKLYYDTIYTTQPVTFRYPSGRTVHYKQVDAVLIATPYERSGSIITSVLHELVQQADGTVYDMHQLTRDAIRSACPLTDLVHYAHYRYYPCSRNDSPEDNPLRLVVIQQKLDKALKLQSPWETNLYKRAQILAEFTTHYDAAGPHHLGLILIPDIDRLEKYATQDQSVGAEHIAHDVQDHTTVYDDNVC